MTEAQKDVKANDKSQAAATGGGASVGATLVGNSISFCWNWLMSSLTRPKGRRGSYRQWQEDNIGPQVVFEILSPSHTPAEMRRKLEFYEHYGVEEYYQYDPDELDLCGWYRDQGVLVPIIAVCNQSKYNNSNEKTSF